MKSAPRNIGHRIGTILSRDLDHNTSWRDAFFSFSQHMYIYTKPLKGGK
jgi:hypothetical protein